MLRAARVATRMQQLSEIPRRFASWDPFDEALRLFGAAPTAAAGLPAPLDALAPGRWARMDVADAGDAFDVSVELPGVRREDVAVHMDGNRLYVQARRVSERTEGEAEGDRDADGKGGGRPRTLVAERYYGAIRRTVELPESCDPENVSARYADGVLRIRIGKHPGSRGTRQITVQ